MKLLSGMKETIHDLILCTWCPMVLPYVQKDETSRKEKDIRYC